MAEKSLKKNAFYSVLRTIMSLLFPLITFPYASRILLPEGTGKVNFANSIINYFIIISGLGISSYAVREASKLRHDKLRLSIFCTEVFIINAISTVVSYSLLFLTLFLVPRLFELRVLILVCSTTILFTSIGFEWLYNAMEEYRYISIRSVFFQIVSVLLLFLLVQEQDDYIIYAGISVFASVGSNVCNAARLHKFCTPVRLGLINIKQHIKSIMVFFGVNLALSVFTVLDISMLGILSTDEQVGYYSAATKLIHIIRNLFPAVFTVVFPRLSIFVSNSDFQEMKAVVHTMLVFLFCLSLPAIAGLYILAKPVVVVLSGPSFLPALPSMYVMIPTILFSSFAGFIGGTLLNALHKEKLYLVCVTIAAATNFILNVPLISFWESFGASLSTLFTEFLLVILYLSINRRFIQFGLLLKNILQFIVATAIMSVVCWYLRDCFVNVALQIVVVACSGLIVYFLVLLVIKNTFATDALRMLKKRIIYRGK